MPRTLAPYKGNSRKLVLAFDIGTTYSGAAYAFLDPEKPPEIVSISKYLDNPNVGTSKVPSILYYDQDGNFIGVENGTGLADDEELLQMKWWKLMLGPTEPPEALKEQMPETLPKGKTIIDLFADFMNYLFESTKALFISSDQLGELRWNSVSDSIELVLTHPNGWGGAQQSQLRTAAVRAKIVPDTSKGHASVHFVTEGEASFNFCVINSPSGEDLKNGNRVMIVDAGGGTIDISCYSVTKNSPLQVEELFRPQCLLQGGEFVTARARQMVKEKFRDSDFDTPEDILAFAQKFDVGLKRVFSDDQKTQFVKFGGPRDNDTKCGIKAGKLTLTGQQVGQFFEPSIKETVDSIRTNFQKSNPSSTFAFFVGGFASSPWLADQLGKRLSSLGLKFFKPDTNTDKAVAVGAISYYLDRPVKRRITQFAYGIPYCVPYKGSDPEHVRRNYKAYTDELGDKYVPDAFDTMLSKGSKVLENREIRTKLHLVFEGSPEGSAFARIFRYDGDKKNPKWTDVERDKFETLCHIHADISAAPYTRRVGSSREVCYYREFDVVLLVGFTELKAQIRWNNPKTGKEESGEATIVYEDASEDNSDGSRVPPPLYSDLDW